MLSRTDQTLHPAKEAIKPSGSVLVDLHELQYAILRLLHRAIADEVGARVVFDAAHQCGIIAGKAWHSPLEQGAHFMTMSTYKCIGGPAGGLIVTNDADIAEILDTIAFPGMAANFDAAKSAALAVTMLDGRDFGELYVAEMIAMAKALADHLDRKGVPVFKGLGGSTASHQFAVLAEPYGGAGRYQKFAQGCFFACGIGLPVAPVPRDMNGLRMGTPELVRWGMLATDAEQLASLIVYGLNGEDVANEVAVWRKTFSTMCIVY